MNCMLSLLVLSCYALLSNKAVYGVVINIEENSLSEDSSSQESSEDDDMDILNKLSDMDLKLNELLKRLGDNNSITYLGCEDRWIPFNASCYYFGSAKVNFSSAKTECQRLKSNMVIVETSEENAFIKTFMKSIQGEQTATSYWLGLTEYVTQNIWVWQNYEAATFFDWGPTEPDPSKDEACVWIEQVKNYQWSDVACNRATKPICEKRKSSIN